MSPSEKCPTRSEQKQLSRQKLLEATIDIVAEEGLEGVTFAKVSTRSGLSRGLCSFHFKNKEQLLLEILHTLYQEFEQAWRSALEKFKGDPQQQLIAIIETLLSTPVSDPRAQSVLVSFWGVAPHRQRYLEFCTESDLIYEQEIEKLLRELAGGATIINGMSLRAIAVMLTSIIEGVHVQYLIAPDRLSNTEAIQGCLTFLQGFFPGFGEQRS